MGSRVSSRFGDWDKISKRKISRGRSVGSTGNGQSSTCVLLQSS